jgi:hypothetical protein
MATDIYPMWGESSGPIAQQAYQWANLNYANQGGNIARRQDFDRQDIANQQNYFQMERAIEAEDARRQEQARIEAERLALAQGESLRRNYQFGQEQALKKSEFDIGQAFREKQLKAGIESDRLRYAPLPEPKPEDIVAELNAYVADMRAKTAPEKFNHDAVAGLRVKLPASIQSDVYYNPADFQFHFSKPAATGIGEARRAEAYSFSPTTGTTPPPVAAAAQVSAPPAMQGEFLIMKNPQGRNVRVRFDQINKARALGYYE